MINLLKKIVIEIMFKTVIVGAFLGILVGMFILYIADTYCGFRGIEMMTWLQANTDVYLMIKLWFGCWAIAGIVAKILPW